MQDQLDSPLVLPRLLVRLKGHIALFPFTILWNVAAEPYSKR